MLHHLRPKVDDAQRQGLAHVLAHRFRDGDAARLGQGYYASTTYSLTKIRRLAAFYRAACEAIAAHGEGASGPVVSVNRLALVATSAEEAHVLGRAHLGPVLHRYAGLGALGPELQAHLVAEEIAEQLSKRASFRRTMKRVIDQTMEAGAKGVKIQLSGRLGGAEMARCEKQNAGSIPLSTLRTKIDYGFVEAKTPQGNIGVQVWVNQGMFEDETDGADAQEGQAPKKPKRTYKR